MPLYEYVCPEGHVTEQKGALDQATIECAYCKQEARRRPAYLSQGVRFPGVGFTRTVIPPAQPRPDTIHGEPQDDWFEKVDEFAEKQYDYDTEVRPEAKKQLKRMMEEVERGAIP